MRRALLVAAALVAVLGVSGCGVIPIAPAPEATSTPTGEPVPAGLEPYYHQELRWASCEAGLECATAVAPMDWDDPAGERIDLALIRTRATGERLGSLLVNPGGPGGSGYDMVRARGAQTTTARVAAGYDIVGFDPRGVGRSTAVSCAADDAARDHYFFGIASGVPGSEAWIEEVGEAVADWSAGCLEHTGPLLEHVDTRQAARDLDMLRAALGDERLHYLGFSYGTFLGATYAELFPDRAGRLVLDGGLDPSISLEELVLGQAVGFEHAYRNWLATCLTQADCPFTGTVETAFERTGRVFELLGASPLTAEDGRVFGADALFTATILPLYDPMNWGYLVELYTEVLRGETAIGFLIVDSMVGRLPDGSYSGNQAEAGMAINCLDLPSDADPAAMRAEAERLQSEAPLFGPLMSWGGLGCSAWPFPASGVRQELTAAGAPDILVIGTSGDPATPYDWSVALAGQLESGHLVSYTGDGHTAYNRASACVDDAVDEFLLTGTVPAADPDC